MLTVCLFLVCSPAESDLCLIFGNEIKGLEVSVSMVLFLVMFLASLFCQGANLDAHATNSNLVYFPMKPGIRSFNLSTTVCSPPRFVISYCT